MEAEYTPTPAEIKSACLEIQAGWSDDERERRSVEITDRETPAAERCSNCGNIVSLPCVYCQSKAARSHNPSEFVCVHGVDTAGIADAQQNAREVIEGAFPWLK